jgi:hypothetical protein
MAPRPDLSGLRVQQYGDPNVYLMDQGPRRWIPSATVMAQLFTHGTDEAYRYHPAGTGVVLDLHVNLIDAGFQLPEECILFQAADSPQVFLLDQDASGNQIRRWITSAAAMDRYQFDWEKIKHWDVPLAGLDLPDGPHIGWP